MKKTKHFSKRLEREVELESIVTDDGSLMITTQSLRGLFKELEATNGLKMTYAFYPTPPVYTYECTITDDEGNTWFANGSVNTSAEKDIPRKHPSETAKARGESAVIIEYLGLDGRCYSDTSLAPENTETSEPTLYVPKKDKGETKKTAQKNIPKEDVQEETNTETSATVDPGEYIINFGKKWKGYKVKDIDEAYTEWILGIEKPKGELIKVQEMVKLFVAQQEALTGGSDESSEK